MTKSGAGREQCEQPLVPGPPPCAPREQTHGAWRAQGEGRPLHSCRVGCPGLTCAPEIHVLCPDPGTLRRWLRLEAGSSKEIGLKRGH